jgi:hypothetical protein
MLYISLNFVGIVKSRRMGWAGNLIKMAESRNSYRSLVGKRPGKTEKV